MVNRSLVTAKDKGNRTVCSKSSFAIHDLEWSVGYLVHRDRSEIASDEL